jgi:hypothetical protein
MNFGWTNPHKFPDIIGATVDGSLDVANPSSASAHNHRQRGEFRGASRDFNKIEYIIDAQHHKAGDEQIKALAGSYFGREGFLA